MSAAPTKTSGNLLRWIPSSVRDFSNYLPPWHRYNEQSHPHSPLRKYLLGSPHLMLESYQKDIIVFWSWWKSAEKNLHFGNNCISNFSKVNSFPRENDRQNFKRQKSINAPRLNNFSFRSWNKPISTWYLGSLKWDNEKVVRRKERKRKSILNKKPSIFSPVLIFYKCVSGWIPVSTFVTEN